MLMSFFLFLILFLLFCLLCIYCLVEQLLAVLSCLVLVYCIVLSSDARLCSEKPYISKDIALDSAIDFLVVKDCNRIAVWETNVMISTT